MSESDTFKSHSSIAGENTLGPYRQCSDGTDPGVGEELTGALPIRRVLVSRLRLRQARYVWVFNRNELKTKGLPDGKSRDKNDVRLRV